MIRYLRSFNKTKLVVPITAAYFFVALIEIVAESNQDFSLIAMTKPLLMPIMLAMYVSASKKIDAFFVLSLLIVWMANLFQISDDKEFMFLGSLCYLAYSIVAILIIFRVTKFPGYLPMLIGCLPFLFLYLFIANLAYNQLGEHFSMFIIQGIFVVVFGGFSLGSYILKSNRSNTYLLASAVLFTIAQFLLAFKIYYAVLNIFQPLAMLAFVCGQYLLYLYLILEERKKRRYKSISSKKQQEPDLTMKQ